MHPTPAIGLIETDDPLTPDALPPLRLARLRLTDFRSYPSLEARFEGRVVVIAGENGAGKTNLLEAISLLGPGRGLRGARAGEIGRRAGGQAHPWAAWGRFEGPHGASDIATGTVGEEGYDARRKWRLDGEPLRSSAELADRAAAVWLTPQMDRLFQEGASGRRRFLDRLVWALEPGHAREVAAHETAMSGRNRLLAEGRRDAAAGGSAVGAHRADLAMIHLPKDLPAELCSTGEQKALLVSVVLAHATLIGAARGFAPLLLLDEIAAHLDAARREALYDALLRLPAQVFLTGTEPDIFAGLRGTAEGFRATPSGLVPSPDFPVPKPA